MRARPAGTWPLVELSDRPCGLNSHLTNQSVCKTSNRCHVHRSCDSNLPGGALRFGGIPGLVLTVPAIVVRLATWALPGGGTLIEVVSAGSCGQWTSAHGSWAYRSGLTCWFGGHPATKPPYWQRSASRPWGLSRTSFAHVASPTAAAALGARQRPGICPNRRSARCGRGHCGGSKALYLGSMSAPARLSPS